MVLAYHGRHVPMEDIRRVTGVSRDCLNAGDMVRAGRHYGLECAAYSREPDDLRRMAFPFVAHQRFIHFVVVEGMTVDRVLVNDPACGRSEIPIEAFHESFTGIVITFKPGPDFAPGGTPDRLFSDLWRRIDGGTKALLGLAVLLAALSPLTLVGVADILGTGTGHLWEGLAVISSLLLLRVGLQLGQSLITETAYRRISAGQSGAFLETLLRRPFAYLSYRLPSEQVKSTYDIDLIARLLCRDLLPVLLMFPAIFVFLAALFRIDETAGSLAAALTVLNGACLAALSFWRAGDGRGGSASGNDDAHAQMARIATIESDKVAGMNRDYVAATMGGQASSAIYEQRAAEARIAAQAVSHVSALGVVFGTALIAGGSHVAGTVDIAGLLSAVFLSCALAHSMRDWPGLRGKWSALHHALLRQDDLGSEDAAHTDAPPQPPAAAHSLRFENVVFGHTPTRPPLLNGVDFAFQTPAEQVGITGASGGGKSTFASVAAGLHAPWTGTLETGRHVLWIDKSPFLFAGTVRENLLIWRNDVDDAALWRALEDACLADVIGRRPDGLDTAVVARGQNFSGGQRQRLEIARALTFEPKVLILDEALDALNPELELRLRANLRRRDCALLVVSHRASTLEACDRVLHFSDGRLLDYKPAPETGREDRTAVQIETLFPAASDNLRAPVTSPRELGHYTRTVHYVQPKLWRQPHLPLLGRRLDTDEQVHLLPTADGYRIDGEERAVALDEFGKSFVCVYPNADLQIQTPFAQFLTWMASATTDLLRALTLSGATTASVVVLTILTALPYLDDGTAPAWKLWLSLTGGLIVIGLLSMAQQMSLLRAEQRIDVMAKNDFAQRLIHTQAWFFRAMTPEDLSRAFDGHFRALALLKLKPLADITDTIVVLGGSIALALLDARVALAVFAFSVIGVAVRWIAGCAHTEAQRDADEKRLSGHRFLSGMMQSIARLRVVGGLFRAAAHWRALFGAELASSARMESISALGRTLGDAWLWASLGGLVFVMSHTDGGNPAWRTVIMVLLSWPVLSSAFSIGTIMPDTTRVIAAFPDFRRLLAAPLDPDGVTVAAAPPLDVVHASFHYPGTTDAALTDISLHLEPGAFTAIVGPSGSGKSTLLRLLLAFEQPTGGNLRIDGHDVAEIDTAAWRAGVGVVQQEDYIDRASTIRSIISGMAQVRIEDVWRAADLVLLSDDIRTMPMGMQTIVEHGKLSTGQEQRLLIARQLLRQPSLLILDEATNAIPEDVQARIFANLRAEGIGCILATHRESAIAAADRVIVLQDGRLRWEGSSAAFTGNREFSELVRRERLVEASE